MSPYSLCRHHREFENFCFAASSLGSNSLVSLNSLEFSQRCASIALSLFLICVSSKFQNFLDVVPQGLDPYIKNTWSSLSNRFEF